MTRPRAVSPALETVSDEDLAARRAAALTQLQTCPDKESADHLYRSDILCLEREAVFRRRAQNGTVDLLFITVGGQVDTPIAAGLAWNAVHLVLLHTDKTKSIAQQTAEQLDRRPGDFELRSIGRGTDPSALYRRLRDEWAAHGKPRNTVVDLSGGFKTMSAAAAAAGFLLPGARVAYVDTSQPRVHGLTFWLETRVELLRNPYDDFGDIGRRSAMSLLANGRFADARREFDDLADRTGWTPDGWRRDLANALECADRLAFDVCITPIERLITAIPRDCRMDQRLTTDPWNDTNFLAILANRRDGFVAVREVSGREDPTADTTKITRASYLDFIEFLLRLSQRRVQTGEYDLAALFAYRAMEAIPQRRLASLGYDVSAFDWEKLARDYGMTPEQVARAVFRPAAAASAPELRPKVDRAAGYAILAKVMKDTLIKASDLEKINGIAESRNRSILAHGFAQIDRRPAEELLRFGEQLFDALLTTEGRTAEERAALKARHAPMPDSFLREP